MKAICVDENRNLQLREIASPEAPADGYVTIRMSAAAINHGDKAFLKVPNAAGGSSGAVTRLGAVWGASGAGRVIDIGAGVPAHYRGRKVAIYRSLQVDRPGIGTWSELAQLHHLNCALLPEDIDERLYSGSLVNIVTAYSFLDQMSSEGHGGIVATAGSSATGRALLALARRRGMPAILIVRGAASRAELLQLGAEHVLVSSEPDFQAQLERLAHDLEVTAVFDGVGGALVGRILVSLPARSSIYFYGFLSGTEPISFHSATVMMKDATMRRFSNFESPTVRDPARLERMLRDIGDIIDEPLFHTPVGPEFSLDAIEEAMAFDGLRGPKAVLVAPSA